MNTAPLSKKMFPASLILEGRRCLVVGGGRVAVLKAAKLADAGAALTVIAPEIKPQIRGLPGVKLYERTFEPEDINGAFLVFAVTGDPALNRRIIGLCEKKGILCSAADSSWPQGDLILPASFSEEGLTVSVSTGGRSCRRSRLLRESLARHIEFMQNVDLFIFGADHETADFQALEKLKARRTDFEKILPCIQGVHEFMILDTCNRFEVTALLSRGQSDNLIKHQIIGLTPLAEGADAFRRLAETAAGLRSQVFGETRIVAQIKEALREAQENRWAGSFLQSWTDSALCISKEIRQAVGPQIPAVEIEDLVFQTLEKKFPNRGKSPPVEGCPKGGVGFLIIGRGEIGQALKKRLPDAVQISGRNDDELRAQLPEADVVICATGSPDSIIGESHRPLLKSGAVLIDLSLPRNIAPALPGVIGLSDLRSAVQPENTDRLFAKARDIIAAHRAEYERLVNF